MWHLEHMASGSDDIFMRELSPRGHNEARPADSQTRLGSESHPSRGLRNLEIILAAFLSFCGQEKINKEIT